MEFNPSTTEATPQRSNSPGSENSFAYFDSNPSKVSSIDTSKETHVVSNADNDDKVVSEVGDEGSENDGFLSGEEDFLTPMDKPVFGDGNFVGYSEFWTRNGQRPIAKVSVDEEEGDDGEEFYVESGPKVRVLEDEDEDEDREFFNGDKDENSIEGMGSGVGSLEGNEVLVGTVLTEKGNTGDSVNENGVSDDQEKGVEVSGGGQEGKVFEASKLEGDLGSTVEGSSLVEKQLEGNEKENDKVVVEHESEVLDGGQSGVAGEVKEANKVVEDSAVVDGGDIQENSAIIEPEVVQVNGVNSTTEEGDSVVEEVNVHLSSPGAAVVGDAPENVDSGDESRDVPVDVGTNLDNEPDFEEPVGLKSMPPNFDMNAATEATDEGSHNDKHINSSSDVVDVIKLPAREDEEKENTLLLDTGSVGDKVLRSDITDGGDGSEPQKDEENSGDGSRDVPVDGGTNLDNEPDSEEPVGLKSPPPNFDMNAATESTDEASHNEKPIGASSDVVDLINVPPMEDEVDVDPEAKGNTLLLEAGSDGDEVLTTDVIDGGDGLEPQEDEENSASSVDTVEGAQSGELEASALNESHAQSTEPSFIMNREISVENGNEEKHLADDEDENEGSVTDGDTEGTIFGSSEAAKQFLEELERGSGSGSYSGADSSREHPRRVDGQIATDSDEEEDTDEENGGKELFDSAALAALLKAASTAGSDGGNITITAQDGSRLFSVERPAGLGSSLPSMKTASRPNHPRIFGSSNSIVGGDSGNTLSDEERKRLEKFQEMRVKYLRLVERLGVSLDDSIARQVLYRLTLATGRQNSHEFSPDAAKTAALQLEAEGKDDLNFSVNILVIGKSGVGKSATINSIFGEEKTPIYAFGPATKTVKEIIGTVDGVKIRVFDTPGLKSSASDQNANKKILSYVTKATKRCPPDIVLYVDRLDTQNRGLNDLPLLKSITSALGPSIWRSAIVTLTHAASSPPDGPSGTPLNYELFVAQQSQIVQQTIGQAVGDLRLMSPSLMNPIALVENHPSCRKNRDGQKVLPNGQSWRSQLFLLCYSMKILSETSNLSKPQDSFDHKKLFGFRVRSPPLPYLLSSLLQSRSHPKLSPDQGGDNGDSDIDLADFSDSDDEEEDEYDQLPSFKPLRKSQIAKLSREQRKAYFEEYDYRVKLLQKKQLKEELRRMKEIKKRGKVSADEYGFMGEEDAENGSPAAVPVALPDMVLPPSFDGDNPAYRYRFLEPTSQFLARPVLDTHGWDHDCGYEGVNVEHNAAIANRLPAAVTVQVTKDKKEFNIHLDSSASVRHGENGSSMAGFDIQNIGKQLAYIVRGETKFKNLRKNKTAAGVSMTFYGENVSTGLKIEDQIAIGKRVVLVGSTGTVRCRDDSAYGANLEVRLREADFPIGQDQSSLGLSLVKWRGDLAMGANFQSQFSLGRTYKMAVRAGLNNKLSGQLSVRTSSSEQLQIALVAILPIVKAIYKSLHPGATESYSVY